MYVSSLLVDRTGKGTLARTSTEHLFFGCAGSSFAICRLSLAAANEELLFIAWASGLGASPKPEEYRGQSCRVQALGTHAQQL